MWGSSGVDAEVDLGSVLPSWRLSTVHPLPCAQPCFSARVAGWDGEEIVVGTVQRAGSGPLNVTLQLAVRPGHGCVGNRCSGVLWSKGRHERNSYRDVRGLRVSYVLFFFCLSFPPSSQFTGTSEGICGLSWTSSRIRDGIVRSQSAVPRL